MLGVAGAVIASMGAGATQGATPFLLIDAVMAVVCVLGAVIAPRVRPDTR